MSTRRTRAWSALLFYCGFASACGEKPFTWAFAQNLDSSFHPSEFCRQSLAEVIYNRANRDNVVREGRANVFLFTGGVESYRIYAFHSQAECETALTAMVMRQRF